jgi:hypothetical protein
LERKRERERRESGWVVRDINLTGGNRAKFTALKVPRQCPLVLLVKEGWRGGKTFGSEGREDEKYSKERS